MKEPIVPISVLFLLEKCDSEEHEKTKYNQGDVFAYWTEQSTSDPKMMTSYAHIGQHSSCHVDYAKECEQATKEQYQNLLNELTSIGYEVTILNDDK